MRSAAKLPDVDNMGSVNSFSVSDVLSRGRNARPKGIKEQNYISQPAHVLSSQNLKPTFHQDPANRFHHNQTDNRSKITDDSGSRYRGMKTAMSSKNILNPSKSQLQSSTSIVPMAEKTVESSIRKGDNLVTLDQNLSASDLASVSPHQKVARAGKTGQSPHF